MALAMTPPRTVPRAAENANPRSVKSQMTMLELSGHLRIIGTAMRREKVNGQIGRGLGREATAAATTVTNPTSALNGRTRMPDKSTLLG